jgi:hypothetical protein
MQTRKKASETQHKRKENPAVRPDVSLVIVDDNPAAWNSSHHTGSSTFSFVPKKLTSRRGLAGR